MTIIEHWIEIPVYIDYDVCARDPQVGFYEKYIEVNGVEISMADAMKEVEKLDIEEICWENERE